MIPSAWSFHPLAHHRSITPGGESPTGPPEGCYPPDGEDDRQLDEAYILVGRQRVDIPKGTQQALFDHYDQQIADVDLTERRGL